VPEGAALTIDSAASSGVLNGVLYAEGGEVVNVPVAGSDGGGIAKYGTSWPGIGGAIEDDFAGTVTINGGVVIAQGGGNTADESRTAAGSAGIGGGAVRDGDFHYTDQYDYGIRGGGADVNVSGGLVIAKGGLTSLSAARGNHVGCAYGIGGGRVNDFRNNSGTLYITGGTVLMNLEFKDRYEGSSSGPAINGTPNWDTSKDSYNYKANDDFVGYSNEPHGTQVVGGDAWSVVLFDDDELAVNGAAQSITVSSGTIDITAFKQAAANALAGTGWSVTE